MSSTAASLDLGRGKLLVEMDKEPAENSSSSQRGDRTPGYNGRGLLAPVRTVLPIPFHRRRHWEKEPAGVDWSDVEDPVVGRVPREQGEINHTRPYL